MRRQTACVLSQLHFKLNHLGVFAEEHTLNTKLHTWRNSLRRRPMFILIFGMPEEGRASGAALSSAD